MKDKSVGKRGRKGTSARNAGRSAEGIADVPEFGGEAVGELGQTADLASILT
jgi:hypothetical protein